MRLPKLRNSWPGGVVLLVALAWRLPHLRWGLPDIEEEALPMKKAFEMWGWESGRVTLDPQTVGWPSLSFYVHLLFQKVHYGVGQLLGHYDDVYDYWLQFQIDPTQLTWLSRGMSAVVGSAVVLICAECARRIAGWRAALVAGLMLAFSPLAIQNAQMITPDILLMFFAALGTLALLRVEARGGARDYVLAGLWAGLGAACKYTPVLLTVAIYVLHLLRLRAEGRSLRGLGLDDRRLGYAALAAALAFCVASPYTFADLEVLKRDFSYQAMHMSRGHFGHEDRGFGPVYYVRKVLAPALGWPGLLLGLGGVALAWRRTRVPGLVFGVFFLGLGFLSTQFDRYMLPALLPLCWGVAHALHRLRDRVRQRRGPAWQGEVAWLLPLFLILIAPGIGARDLHRRQARPSTQQQAKQFVMEHFPAAKTTLAVENYTVFLPYEQSDEWRRNPVFQKLSAEQQSRLLDRDFYRYQVIPMYAARTELSAYYYDLRHYVAYDWILTSSSVRGRFQRQPDRFPDQNRFYEDLERYCEMEHRFGPDGGGRGPDVRFYRFRDDGEEDLLRDRGSLPAAHWEAYRERLYAPHFYSFVDNTALHALLKNRFDIAEKYYAIELATCTQEERPRVLGQLAFAKLRLSKWDESARYYAEMLRSKPNDPVALGNFGYAQWKLGKVEEARASLRRCIQVAGEGETSRWARERLAEIDREESP